MAITWKASMRTGDKTVDKQHKDIILAYNKLVKYLERHAMPDLGEVRNTLHILYKYTSEHFKYEEDYMKRMKHAGINKHKKVYNKFMRIFDSINKEFHKIYTSKDISGNQLGKLLKKIENFLGTNYLEHMLRPHHKSLKR
jgi:hemerythrin-like metal-binding protein